ncbi:MAG: hypothetical protein COT17_06120 [Elusimicrobia bacterium CG08_land_8_20_14_0_20_51_18]|nr:MAG: hypothetical protein COT17_06120 [Elusimicrobia bacterium CG08_land_8_20_14_0_20_51_18]
MKKVLKIFLWTGIAFVAAAAVSAVALKLYFTQERLKSLVSEYSARYLSREVSFGSVSVGLSGFSLRELRVSERPDFSKGEFASAGEVSLRPSLRELFRRRVVIESVSASGLKLRVVELKKDVYNFSDLLEPADPGATADVKKEGEKGGSAPLSVSSLKVRDSAFSYRNAAGDLAVDMKKIDLSASDISPDGLFPVEAELVMDVNSPAFKGSLPAKLKGRVALGGFDVEKGRAEIEKGEISFSGVEVSFKGSLSNLMEPDAKLSISVKPFSLASLKGFIKEPPALALPAAEASADFKLRFTGIDIRSLSFSSGFVRGSLKGSKAWEPEMTYDLSLEVSADLPETDSAALAALLKGFKVPPGLKLPPAKFTAKASLKNGRADISGFSLSNRSFSLSGASRADFGGKELRASGSLKADLKDIAEIAAAAPAMTGPYKPSGSASAALDYSYAGKMSAKGKASLKGLGASFADHVLSGLAGDVNFTMDSASSGKLAGKLDGQDFTASFSAKNLSVHPKAEFEARLAKLVLKDLPAGQSEKKAGTEKKPEEGKPFYSDVSGRVEIGAIEHPNFNCAPVSMSMKLLNISGDMKALDGSASFSAGAGKFSELFVFAGRYPAAKVALTPLLVLRKVSKAAPALKLPDFNNISFEKIEGDYSFDKGLMRLNKSALVSSTADADSSGTVNLPSGKLDMKMNIKLRQDSGVRMTEPLGMLVTGTMDDPKVKADIKSIVKQPAVKKAVEKLTPAAEKMLKKLFK